MGNGEGREGGENGGRSWDNRVRKQGYWVLSMPAEWTISLSKLELA